MTEINIILDTDFNDNSKFNKNDKEIFYEELNNSLNLYKYNSYSNYKIEYNQIVENFLLNDNILEYEKELNNINIDIKKLLIKKILIFFNPIVSIKNLNQLREIYETHDLNKKKKTKIVVDRNNILLNYPINLVYLINKNKYTKFKLANNTNILLNGLINSKYYNNNLPYNLNNYKYINLTNIDLLSKIFKQNIYIYLKNLQYKNKGFFNLDKVNNNDLKELYKLYLDVSNLYFDNIYYINNLNNTQSIIELKKEYNLYNDIIKFNKNNIKLVDEKFNKNYINEFNKFLNYKINNNFNNHSYFAFESNNLLELYEQILIYSIDNKKIKNQIELILEQDKNNKLYNENKKIINEYNLKQIQLELLTKKKFPNLFNPNSKELLFTNFKPFNFENLPKKYREVILIEYKKLQNYKEEYIKNKCKHKDLINKLSYVNNKYTIVQEISKLIKNINNNDNYYKCIICSYNLICPHILEYYNLLFDKKNKDTNDKNNNEFSIRQRIINKYMTDAKINMIYYCKICGEELGKSLDLEQNIEYKDKIKLNTAEYTDDTLELVKNNLNHILYTYVMFTELNLNVTKRYLINYIMNNIMFYMNNVEKSLRKSKLYNDEMINNLLNFNSIIFIYSYLIYIMSKYPFISFIQKRIKTGNQESISDKLNKNIIIQKKSKSSIIIPKKVKLESTKDLLNIMKTRFKEAYELIISTNYILLNKLNYIKNLEQIKELLLKTYGIIAKSDQITITEKEKSIISNENLLLNSNIYNYFYLIKCIYPLSNKKSNYISSFGFNDNLYEVTNKKSKINDFNYILNKKIDNVKIDYLFDKFQSSIILNDLTKITEIKDYNDYKIISFNLFNFHIKNELYNMPIYEIIENKINTINKNLKKSVFDNIYLDTINNKIINKEYELYEQYIKLSHLVKIYEINIINKNIIYNNYPYSLIKLNNLRYYLPKNINLNIYFCNKDGFPHKYNIYIYKLNKKDIEVEKNKLDNFINSLNNNDNLEFIDYKCNKCLQLKNKIYLTEKFNNSKINELINNINDINGFFNLYINICPITTKSNEYQFHNFDYNNSNNLDNSDNISCKICKIKYIDLINKNKDIYYQYNKEYNTYKEKKLEYFNLKLNNFDIDKNKLKNLNIINNYKNLININDNKKYIEKIDKLILDNIIIDLSKKYKIDIIYLQKLGLTEGYNYEEINNIKIDNTNIDNRLNKLNTYMRNILIYYNLLKNNKSINNYYDSEFNDILNNLKDINIKLYKDLPEYNINLSNILIELKLHKDNKDIIHFYLKSIFHFILDLDILNKTKFNNKLNIFIEFIINKVLKYDKLFSNYNYSQLKQMFTEDKFDINYTFEETQENENEEDDELFGYNDLNINFEDEEPINE